MSDSPDRTSAQAGPPESPARNATASQSVLRTAAGKTQRRGRKSSRRRPVVPLGLNGGIAAERLRLVEYLKLLAWWLGRPPTPTIPPRMDLVLRGLLRGLSEKEIAYEMKLTVSTVHEYVKELHRKFEVNSRGELLARFLPAQHAPHEHAPRKPDASRGTNVYDPKRNRRS